MPAHAGQPGYSRPCDLPPRSGFGWISFRQASDLDDDVILLNRHGDRFGDVGTLHQRIAGGDLHRVLSGLDARRLAPGLSVADVEFPAMPGAANDFARPRHAVLAGD